MKFCLRTKKTEYKECKFSKRHNNANLEMKIRDHTIPQVIWSKYLRSIIQKDKETEGHVKPLGSNWVDEMEECFGWC